MAAEKMIYTFLSLNTSQVQRLLVHQAFKYNAAEICNTSPQ